MNCTRQITVGVTRSSCVYPAALWHSEMRLTTTANLFRNNGRRDYGKNRVQISIRFRGERLPVAANRGPRELFN